MSGRATIPTIEQQGLSILQLNVEGLTKLDIILHLAHSHKVASILLQETHCGEEDILKLPGFDLAGSILSKQHGIATLVRSNFSRKATGQSPPGSSVEWLSTTVQATSVVNVYKPPPSPLSTSALPSVLAPTTCAGDFNCQHADWGYSHTTPDGETLCEWTSTANAQLLFDPKEPPSFLGKRIKLSCVVATVPTSRFGMKGATTSCILTNRQTPGRSGCNGYGTTPEVRRYPQGQMDGGR